MTSFATKLRSSTTRNQPSQTSAQTHSKVIRLNLHLSEPQLPVPITSRSRRLGGEEEEADRLKSGGWYTAYPRSSITTLFRTPRSYDRPRRGNQNSPNIRSDTSENHTPQISTSKSKNWLRARNKPQLNGGRQNNQPPPTTLPHHYPHSTSPPPQRLQKTIQLTPSKGDLIKNTPTLRHWIPALRRRAPFL